MCDEVRAHALGDATSERLLEGGERHARRLDGAQGNHYGTLSTIAWRRQREIDGTAVLPDAHTGGSHPAIRLRLGDEFLDMTVWNDHEPLAGVRARADAISLIARQPRGPHEAGYGTEFVRREETRLGCGLNRERCFELEKLMQRSFGSGVARGKPEPVTKQFGAYRRLPGVGVPHRRVFEELGKSEPGRVTRDLEPGMKLLTQCDMKWSVDEIVRLFHSDLAARLGEVAFCGRYWAQCIPCRRRPRRHLH